MEKRRNCSSGAISPLFHIILYIYIFLTSGVKLLIHLLNVVVQFIVFLTLSTLICRSTDISKCFSESLGIRDNGSRRYIIYYTENVSFLIFWKLYRHMAVIKLVFSMYRKLYLMEMLMIKSEETK